MTNHTPLSRAERDELLRLATDALNLQPTFTMHVAGRKDLGVPSESHLHVMVNKAGLTVLSRGVRCLLDDLDAVEERERVLNNLIARLKDSVERMRTQVGVAKALAARLLEIEGAMPPKGGVSDT